MKWIKVDYKGDVIRPNTGWHLCNYKSGAFEIINAGGKYILKKDGDVIGTFKTLKAAKATAEA